VIFRALIAHTPDYQETLNIAAPDFNLAKRAVEIGHPHATLLWLWPVVPTNTPLAVINHNRDRDLPSLSSLARVLHEDDEEP
jgi:hypothetical protein